MPYAIFICLVGVMTAVVNTRKVFFLASLNALILNIVQIALLWIAGKFAGSSNSQILYILSATALFIAGAQPQSLCGYMYLPGEFMRNTALIRQN